MSGAVLLKHALKPIVFLLCFIPFAHLVFDAFTGGLGVNALETVTDRTGNWAIRFLLISLTLRPLRQITRRTEFMRFRRMVGLFAFFYASLHFTIFIAIDNFFDFDELIEDIAERPFVTIGFTAWIAMLPLAVTSTRGWIRRLSGKRWQTLHRLVYVSVIAAVVHFLWARKLVEAGPVVYTSAAVLVLGFRLVVWLKPELVSRRAG